ncbi:hypothetical protein DL546_002788 [Coniochaeta pulveracea]|uniref:EKC/KEOPS complex subunit GON7 n=1 Tax=Coniochaeta pulveracea TaxID=177199 RepID=A0A420Y7V2_9PEZI|nr:hypothetical protein DL546_002788 [Coniochaeta pulveracea]
MASLSATYTSPTNAPFSVTKSLTVPAVAEVQNEVNRELTARMEEDKARDASAKAGVDDAKEEENYGEEVVEEED